ncbi:MAG: metallophosphoesterase [Jiangellaceae bacterium]|nr:metallophosphoesterase [Jiangellaceae bacterium]
MIAPATPPSPGWLRRAAPWFATVVSGLAGAWLALVVAGATPAAIGPVGVEAGILPAWGGETVVQLDPVGTLVVDTHNAPLKVRVDVRTVDVDGLRTIVGNPTALSGLDEQLVDDLRGVLTKAAVRSAAVAVLGAALVGGLLLRSWQRGLVAGAVAVGAVAGSYGLAAATFDPDAAREPRFTGLLTSAPQLIGSVEQIATNFDAYADQLARLVANVSRLYNTTQALPAAPSDDTIRLLHVSDLHLNPGAWSLIRAVGDQYDVDAIVDTGDIADHGTAPESVYVRPIATLGRPYVFVKGNHDSVLTQAAVAAAPNAVVLNGEAVSVAGLTFLGAPDPRFTPDQSTRGTADEDIQVASEELARKARALGRPPEVLVFHDPTYAEDFDGAAPLLLAGHAHRRRTVVLEQETRVMVQGSTGGAGLRALEGEEPTPVSLSVLYIDWQTHELVAWDDITLGGLGLTSAEIQRHRTDEDDGNNGPNGPTEAPPSTPSPSPE